MKLAFWSPLSPQGTGIADYSEELLPYLVKGGADIHLFVDDYEPTSPIVAGQFPWHYAREYEEVAEREKFDLNLYQMGNSGYHRYALNQALRFDEAIGLTGITMTKLDGGGRGGILLAIAERLEVPFRFIGMGEQREDMAPFEAGPFVEALLGDTDVQDDNAG